LWRDILPIDAAGSLTEKAAVEPSIARLAV
jgi:hypothetical protein